MEKIRTEKKATKRMLDPVRRLNGGGAYQVMVIHGNAPEKAAELQQNLLDIGTAGEVPIATFGSVIGTHLGKGSAALVYSCDLIVWKVPELASVRRRNMSIKVIIAVLKGKMGPSSL